MKMTQWISTLALGGILMIAATGASEATTCRVDGKIALVEVAAGDHRPSGFKGKVKVIVSELESLSYRYFRFWTDDEFIATQLGSAHAANHTVHIEGDSDCHRYDHDKPQHKFDGDHINRLKVFSRQ